MLSVKGKHLWIFMISNLFLSSLAAAEGVRIDHRAFVTPIEIDPKRVFAPVGDFDGDGRTDLFSVTREKGQNFWEIAAGASSPWKQLGPAYESTQPLAFGDFDGDKKADVFIADKSTAYFVPGGIGKPRLLMKLSSSITGLRFGDFDGDGRTDLFYVDTKGSWRVSSGGRTKWSVINRLGGSVDDYLFGDFDGDGRTDVYTIDRKGQAQYSAAGQKPWVSLAPPKFPLSDLRVADIDGDGAADLLTVQNGLWLVSLSGKGQWSRLFRAKAPLSDIRLADVLGDGRDDVFVATRTKDQITWSFVNDASSRWQQLYAYDLNVTSTKPKPNPKEPSSPADDPVDPPSDPGSEQPVNPSPDPAGPSGTNPGTSAPTGAVTFGPHVFTRVTAPGRCAVTEMQINTCSASSGYSQANISQFISLTQDNLATGCCQALADTQSHFGSATCEVIKPEAKQALGCSY